MISFDSSGSFDNIENFIKRMSKSDIYALLNSYGATGVAALGAATPTDTGKTANSWGYKVVKKRDGFRLEFYNTNINDNAQVALLIQYGHGTGTGGYVSGIDYINPAMQPIFDRIVAEIWREVQK